MGLNIKQLNPNNGSVIYLARVSQDGVEEKKCLALVYRSNIHKNKSFEIVALARMQHSVPC